MLDDHSRLFLASVARPTFKAADVADAFRSAVDLHGAPASLLCDNGAVFTARPRGGKVLLQIEMERLGVIAKNSRPYHPQTCGKVERLHQTLKRYLDKQDPAKTLAELGGQLDAFAHYYNAIRPHRALRGRTPLQAYSARVKAGRPQRPAARPTSAFATTESTPRAPSPCATTQSSTTSASAAPIRAAPIKLLVADRDIRVLDLGTGELIRRLTLDPSRDYQPIGGGRGVYDVARHLSPMSRHITRGAFAGPNPHRMSAEPDLPGDLIALAREDLASAEALHAAERISDPGWIPRPTERREGVEGGHRKSRSGVPLHPRPRRPHAALRGRWTRGPR